MYTPKDVHPLDLHVLGTPPAFVLHQDQTLRGRVVVLSTPGLLQEIPKSLFHYCTMHLRRGAGTICSLESRGAMSSVTDANANDHDSSTPELTRTVVPCHIYCAANTVL